MATRPGGGGKASARVGEQGFAQVKEGNRSPKAGARRTFSAR
jgi:hypothetical protein